MQLQRGIDESGRLTRVIGGIEQRLQLYGRQMLGDAFIV